ncbi:MAG: LacI family DNA-binding transcriptional regulator [Bacteroidales bacterium]
MGHHSINHIRIKDIAEKAGCSIGTVDRVLHNRGRVSGDLQRRILGIMDELGYRPNVNARVLASNRTLNLGILLPSFRKGEYWELPNQGINDAMEHFEGQGYSIETVTRSFSTAERFYESGLKLIQFGVDGIITMPAAYKESVRLVRTYFQNNIPFILIDSDIAGLPSLSFIGKDPVQSGLTAAGMTHQVSRHIKGCKIVWIINLPKNLEQMYPLMARESGYMKFFVERGIRNQYTMRTFDIEDPGSQKAHNAIMEEMFREERPHAIYVTGSRVHKVARSIGNLGLDPRPMVIGHDLIDANVREVNAGTIDFLIDEEAHRQGYLAVETMVRSIIWKERIEPKQWMNLMIYTRENLSSEGARPKSVRHI